MKIHSLTYTRFQTISVLATSVCENGISVFQFGKSVVIFCTDNQVKNNKKNILAKHFG